MSSISTNCASNCVDSFSFKPSAVTPDVLAVSAMDGFATAKDLNDRLENGDALVSTGVIGLLTKEGRVVERTRERYPLLRIARRTNMRD